MYINKYCFVMISDGVYETMTDEQKADYEKVADEDEDEDAKE